MAIVKLKTHSGAKKRFRFSKDGKIKRNKSFKSHKLNACRKDAKRKRNLRHATYADATNMEKLRKIMPYGG